VANSALKRFQERLKALRKQRDWTQEFAAEKCGIFYKVYQFLEIGVSKNPTLETFKKLASGFGIGLHSLFTPNLPLRPKGSARRKR
jgi:transcriptional regulator with XRE-family HTH domain